MSLLLVYGGDHTHGGVAIPPSTSSGNVTPHAICTACGCDCDDIELHHDGKRITSAQNACEKGRGWFQTLTSEAWEPAAQIDQQNVTLDDAITHAAELLQRADSPLIFGLDQATSEAQRQAIALAESLGATLDTPTSLTHGSIELAAQMGGKITCTLGEVKNRADLIIYWGANPAVTHPRHFERYSADATGKFTPRGRADRTLVVVDVRETPSSAEADIFLKIQPNQDYEALSILRAIIQGSRFDESKLAATGLTITQLRELARRMEKARYGIIFLGMGLFQTRGTFMNCAAVTALAIEMNSRTRFISMPMRATGNISGADAVLSYTTAYPFAVNFSRGYPRYNPGEFSAAEMLTRREVDTALVVGDRCLESLPTAARDHLARIPTIVLSEKPTPATVHITTTSYAPGTVYRMDKVPLTVRPVIRSAHPMDEEVLRQIKTKMI